MAHNLKLEIFRISLKTKGGSNVNLLNYQEFFKKAFLKNDKDEAYKEFIKQFISIFNNEFKVNADKTKAISSSSETKYAINANCNIIDGEIIGGPTGIEQKFYQINDAKTEKGKIKNDNVTALPFYIKIWTPYDHNTGILMIQSYSNHTVTELVKLQLSKLFHNHNYSIIITPYFPELVKKKYKDSSSVYKVAFVKETLSKDKRKLINPLFTEFEGLKIKIEISGFSEKVNDFWSKFSDNEKLISSNLEDFDIKENDDYKTIAYYKDEKGHKSNTSIKKQIEIKPTIFLDDSLKQDDSSHFDFNKIKDHTDSLLNNIKKEIGYDTKKS